MEKKDNLLLAEAYKKAAKSVENVPTVAAILISLDGGRGMSEPDKHFVGTDEELGRLLQGGSYRLQKAWKIGNPLSVHPTPRYYAEQPEDKVEEAPKAPKVAKKK